MKSFWTGLRPIEELTRKSFPVAMVLEDKKELALERMKLSLNAYLNAKEDAREETNRFNKEDFLDFLRVLIKFRKSSHRELDLILLLRLELNLNAEQIANVIGKSESEVISLFVQGIDQYHVLSGVYQ